MTARSLFDDERIVPVVVLDDATAAVPLARTLVEAGIGAIEVTLRTPAAIEAIELIARDVPEILVGAGSLRTPLQVRAVRDRGARFGVSPGATSTLLAAAAESALPFVPGAQTASEMLALFEAGFTLQKFFPAELAGGVAFLEAVAAPLPEIRFMPTGGVTPGNAASYLALDNVSAVGGSWLAPRELLAREDYDAIGQLARDAVQIGV